MKPSPVKTPFDLEQWEAKLAQVKVSKEDMNKLVMNFLVTEGYVEAAETFTKESGTEAGMDVSDIHERMDIRRAVQSGMIEEAIEKVNDLNPEILESQQELFFHLQQQRLIELIRDGKVEEALDFAQENLATIAEQDSKFLEELERTCALLAFEDPESSPVGSLMAVSHRLKTASELNSCILGAGGAERQPRLLVLLQMTLWSQSCLQQKASFPQIHDLASGVLVEPSTPAV